MKFFTITMVVCLLLLGGGCTQPEKQSGIGLPQETGSVTFESVKFSFNTTYHYVVVTNNTSKSIKAEFRRRKEDDSYVNLHLSSVLELPIGSGSSSTFDLPAIQLGDRIEIDLWKDDALTLVDEFLINAPPDFIKETVLVEGDMSVSDSTKRERYDVDIRNNGSSIAGVVCTISGVYYIDMSDMQDRNALYCKNNSSNAVRVQLYLLQDDGGGNYSDFAELVDFTEIPQVGEDSDRDSINFDFQVNDPLALKVTKNVFNPLDVEVYGFRMDHTTGIQTKIIGTIDVP